MKKKVKFLRTVQYENEGRGRGPIYEKDSVHEFDEPFAQRWLRRGVAKIVDEDDGGGKTDEAQARPASATAKRGG